MLALLREHHIPKSIQMMGAFLHCHALMGPLDDDWPNALRASPCPALDPIHERAGGGYGGQKGTSASCSGTKDGGGTQMAGSREKYVR